MHCNTDYWFLVRKTPTVNRVLVKAGSLMCIQPVKAGLLDVHPMCCQICENLRSLEFWFSQLIPVLEFSLAYNFHF